MAFAKGMLGLMGRLGTGDTSLWPDDPFSVLLFPLRSGLEEARLGRDNDNSDFKVFRSRCDDLKSCGCLRRGLGDLTSSFLEAGLLSGFGERWSVFEEWTSDRDDLKSAFDDLMSALDEKRSDF